MGYFDDIPGPGGQATAGNIDLNNRPIIQNPDGSISTERSISFEQDGREILIPTVAADGSGILSNADAIKQYKRTGRHLGIFNSPEEANAAAVQIHNRQQSRYANNQPATAPDYFAGIPDKNGAVASGTDYFADIPANAAPPSTTPASDQAVAEPNTVTGKLGEVWRGIDIKSLPADVGKALVGLIGATESPRAFKQAWDVLHGVPVAQAIPESQTLVGIENKPIEERIKTGFDVATNLGFLKSGEKAVKKAAGTVPAPAEAPPVVGNEQFARVTPVNERAGAAVPAGNPAPAQSTILETPTQPEPKPVVPIELQNPRFRMLGSRARGDFTPQSDYDVATKLTPEEYQTFVNTPEGEYPRIPQDIINAANRGHDVFIETENGQAWKVEPHPVSDNPNHVVVERVSQIEKNLLAGGSKPITEENAAQAATDIGGLSFGGVQSWPADSGIPSTLEFTITEPGKETTLSVPLGITPEELIVRRDQKLADFAAKEQPTEPVAAQPEPTSPVEHGEFAQSGYTAVTDAEPHVSAIANRFTQERTAKGEIGEVAPGQGVSTVDLTQRGLNMAPEEVNQHISDVMNDAGRDPKMQAAAIRGEEARLSQRSNQLSKVAQSNPKDLNAQVAADNAFKDLTDFHNGPVAKLKNNWHAQGMAMQGEIPVDLSTLNGLREKWLKDTGEAPPASIEPTLKRAAERVSKTVAEEKGAMQQLSNGIDKATKSRKFPTADEVRANIRERLGLGPCEV